MKMLILNKQKHNAPRFDELSEMLSGMKDFLSQTPDFKDNEWSKNLSTIIDFQDDDGSFKLFESYKIPVDARVDFCYLPTYLCTAALMKAYLTDSDSFTSKEETALFKGLEMSCVRNLRGHGYEALKGQIEVLGIFMNAGLNEFMDLYLDFCPKFSEMIHDIISKFEEMEVQENFKGPWGESYEAEIRAVNEYFSQRKVFVYGTLMKGESNHHYLENASFLAKTSIEGYDMYDMGWYPAIIPGDSMIVGELYQVPKGDMAAIDMLEGEGHLYAKTCETVTDAEGNETIAFVYVYLGAVSTNEKISAWKDEYVWYVSYGSNMLKERFMCYIEGGSYENSRYHPPCEDTTSPVAVRAVEIPHDMYFANTSGSWHGSGVSFLDVTRNGKSHGVAYLITKKQFEHVVFEENSGRAQNREYGWYEDTISLGTMDGFEVKTITNEDIRPYNQPSDAYLDTLRKGIRENWPEMSDEDIEDYLKNCIR